MSFACEVEIQALPLTGNMIGLDLGIKEVVVGWDGTQQSRSRQPLTPRETVPFCAVGLASASPPWEGVEAVFFLGLLGFGLPPLPFQPSSRRSLNA